MTIPGVTGSIPGRSFVKEMSDFLVDRIPSCLLHDIHMHEGRYVKKKILKVSGNFEISAAENHGKQSEAFFARIVV